MLRELLLPQRLACHQASRILLLQQPLRLCLKGQPLRSLWSHNRQWMQWASLQDLNWAKFRKEMSKLELCPLKMWAQVSKFLNLRLLRQAILALLLQRLWILEISIEFKVICLVSNPKLRWDLETYRWKLIKTLSCQSFPSREMELSLSKMTFKTTLLELAERAPSLMLHKWALPLLPKLNRSLCLTQSMDWNLLSPKIWWNTITESTMLLTSII